MNAFHVMIQTERRVSTQDKPRELAIQIKGQLHTIGVSVSDLTNPQILYAASWNGTSPTVILIKDSIADLKMSYLGWPMTT